MRCWSRFFFFFFIWNRRSEWKKKNWMENGNELITVAGCRHLRPMKLLLFFLISSIYARETRLWINEGNQPRLLEAKSCWMTERFVEVKEELRRSEINSGESFGTGRNRKAARVERNSTERNRNSLEAWPIMIEIFAERLGRLKTCFSGKLRQPDCGYIKMN